MILYAEFVIYPESEKYDSDTPCFVPDLLFKEIASFAPECVHPVSKAFNGYLPYNADVTQKILSLLKESGFEGTRPYYSNRNPNKFALYLVREYDCQDFETSEYLMPRPIDWFCDLFQRDEEGLLKVDYRKIKSKKKVIGTAANKFMLVKESLREKLLKDGFIDLDYKETVVYDEYEDVPYTKTAFEPIYELIPRKVLPPTTTELYVTGKKSGENPTMRFYGDITSGCSAREGLYRPVEFHYNRNEVEDIGIFDLAYTSEKLGNAAEVAFPYIVTSQRFYQFCVKKKLNVAWTPVRID